MDLIVDFTLDSTLVKVLYSLLHFIETFHSAKDERRYNSFPVMIRIIVSDGYPLFESKAENIAFSTENRASYYISVQADMSKCNLRNFVWRSDICLCGCRGES